MPNLPIKYGDLPELNEAPAAGDLFALLDVSTGVTKRITAANLAAGGGNFPVGEGLTFQCVSDPITVVGGADFFGSSALRFDCQNDAFMVFRFDAYCSLMFAGGGGGDFVAVDSAGATKAALNVSTSTGLSVSTRATAEFPNTPNITFSVNDAVGAGDTGSIEFYIAPSAGGSSGSFKFLQGRPIESSGDIILAADKKLRSLGQLFIESGGDAQYIQMTAADAITDGFAGGGFSFRCGAGVGTGEGGEVDFEGGQGGAGGDGGNVTFIPGKKGAGGAIDGFVRIVNPNDVSLCANFDVSAIASAPKTFAFPNTTGQFIISTAVTSEVLVPDRSVTINIGGTPYKLLARA